MTVVDGMVFAEGFPPVIFVGREEGVGLGGGVVDLCETETVGKGQGLTVDRGAADDVDVFVGGAVGEGGFEGRENVDVLLWNVEGGRWNEITFSFLFPLSSFHIVIDNTMLRRLGRAPLGRER